MIADVHFKELQLHIPDQEGNAKFILDDEYMEVLKYALSKFEVSSFSCHGIPHKDFEWCIDANKVMGNEMMNRAGNLEYPELKTYYRKGKIACASGTLNVMVGATPVVLPNGAVVRCCQDYGLRHIYGNLIEQTWQEIVAGAEYEKFEKSMYDESIDSLCRTCSIATENYQEAHNKLKYMQYNAIVAGRILEDIRKNPQKEYPHKDLWDRLLSAEKVAIWGIGKLFSDNYFISWENVIQADFVVDNDSSRWGSKVGSLLCKSPEELLDEKEGLLVITYCMNDEVIKAQLHSMGIDNVINIIELMDATQSI